MHRRQLAMAGFLSILPLVSTAEAQPSAAGCPSAQPPTGSLQLVGPQVRLGDRLFAATSARVEVAAVDAAGRPAQWKPVVGGREAAAWPNAWSAGEHAVSAVVVDRCGSRGEAAPVSFIVDVEPPAIRWEIGDRKAFADRLSGDTERKRRHLGARVGKGKPAESTWESVAGVWQIPVPWDPPEDDKDTPRTQFPVDIASDHPQAFLEADATAVSSENTSGPLDRWILWIAADDTGAGVEHMRLRLRVEGDHAVLEIDAVDMVGNASRKEIPLRRTS